MVPRLPPSGLYTEDGHLFHHINGQPLSKDEIERLREHNVPYQSRSRFTAVEDEQIRKNWARFAEKHGLDYDKAANYAGVPGYTAIIYLTALLAKFDDGLEYYSTQQFSMDKPKLRIQRTLAMKHTEYPNGKAFERVVSKHIRRHRLESEEQYDTLVPFQTIAQEMVYSVDKVKDAWHVVLRSLQENCIQQQEDGKTSKQAWSGALNAVMESAPPISCEDYSKFLRILSDATPSGPLYGTFRWFHGLFLGSLCPMKLGSDIFEGMELGLAAPAYVCDNYFISITRLKEEGIVGFHAAGDDELMYLFDKTRYIMWRVNNLIFRRLKMHYTLKERIHILSLAYDYQFEFSSEHQGRIGRSAEKTDSPLRYLLKVVSKDVLAMFPEKKNNSELIRQRDLETAMTFMDYEVDPELSSSESEGGSSGGDTQRRWPNVDNSHELPSATGREPQYSTSFENSDPPCSRAEKKSNSVVPEDTCVVEESELVSRKRKRMKAIDAATPADHTVCENQPSPEEVPPKKRRGKRKRAADDPQTSEEQERNAENAGDFPSNSVRNSKSDGTETLDVGGTLNDRDHTRLHASQRQRLPYSRE
ncbi:unnamed protein product [Heligmosomoides polygyrus]|uniref:FERM domain-containing protein n=1 Tax=Heligmosomoides polygyrus TaxID=6339 RepID=A0A3P8BUY8_HELPZ|nr:unnamed protein product [Heligmosomoides polygyrus]